MATNEPDTDATKTPENLSVSMQQCYENYIIVDIGANLTNKKYGRDLDSVIQRAKDAGMCTKNEFHIVVVGIWAEEWSVWFFCSLHESS
jgi:TatD DNase family protein